MSKVLVVCARRFNGHELITALGVMSQRGHEFEVISTDYVVQDEITMQPNRIKRIIDDVSVAEVTEFDGLMIVSGNMVDTEAYWTNDKVLSYIRKAQEHNLAIAAICCSVPTIRDVAKGKRVSFFPLVRSKHLLTQAGAILTTVAMTRDDKLVTAEHQMATQIWAEEFCNVLEGKPPEHVLMDSGFVPRGRPRKPIPAVVDWKAKQRKGDSQDGERPNAI